MTLKIAPALPVVRTPVAEETVRALAVIGRAIAAGRFTPYLSARDFAALGLDGTPHFRRERPGDEFLFVVCWPCDDAHPLMLLDNEVASCARCGRRVQFRPEAPKHPRLCIPCTAARIESGELSEAAR